MKSFIIIALDHIYTKNEGMGYKNSFLIKVKIVSSELNNA